MTTNSRRVEGKEGGRDGEREESRWVGMKGVSEEGREGWVTLAAQHCSHGQGKRAGVCVSDTCGRWRTCVLSVSDQRPTPHKKEAGELRVDTLARRTTPRRAAHCSV